MEVAILIACGACFAYALYLAVKASISSDQDPVHEPEDLKESEKPKEDAPVNLPTPELPAGLDELFEAAARLVVLHQDGSVSLLQRKLKIGHNRVGRLLHQLYIAGIVGPPVERGARRALIGSEEELNKHFGRLVTVLDRRAMDFLLEMLQKDLGIINNQDANTKDRLQACETALKRLDELSGFPNYNVILSNYDDLKIRLQATSKAFLIIDHLKRAHRNKFIEDRPRERRNLLEALYTIKQSKITDEDFILSQLRDKETGEIVSKDKIVSRLRKLGWEGSEF